MNGGRVSRQKTDNERGEIDLWLSGGGRNC